MQEIAPESQIQRYKLCTFGRVTEKEPRETKEEPANAETVGAQERRRIRTLEQQGMTVERIWRRQRSSQ